jgi:glycosyltransferase involved in cell wall biosynthesis
MRIGMLTDAYKPHVSGVTNYITLNKRALEMAGHEVYVFTFGDVDYKDDEPNIIRSPGLQLVDTGMYLSISYNRHARHLLRAMDIVHVNHPFSSGSIAWRYCRPDGIPIVFTNHTRYDLYAHAYLPILPNGIGETMLQAYLPAFCRICNLVIAPSEGVRKLLERIGVDAPIEVIPNGVNIEPFTHAKEGLNRAQFGFSADDVILIYVGRLGPEKNLTFLLRAFAGVNHAYNHTRLMIVGEGMERKSMEAQVDSLGIKPSVYFTGLVDYDALPGYLVTADAFVTASVTEVHPLSVIEAMAAGLPVLGIQSPGIGDTVEDGVTGLLTTEDLAAFTAKMVRLVVDVQARRQMGEQARQASKSYEIGRTSQLLLERYQWLVSQSTRRKRGVLAQLSRLLHNFRA